MSEKESEWIIEGLLKKNAINIIEYKHDGWCNKMKDMSRECNCNPDMSIGEIKEKK